MEQNEISEHEVRFYKSILANGNKWSTSREIATQSGIAERTARQFTKKFTELGLIETAKVFPAHRYRIAPKADKTNASYTIRLQRAAEVFAINLP